MLSYIASLPCTDFTYYVLFRYNNNTYRIDDIDWDSTPNKTFELRDGTSISIAAYLKKVRVTLFVLSDTHTHTHTQQYDIQVTDLQQPLLVSRPSKREIRARGGKDDPILLVPEVCTRTGGCGHVVMVTITA